MHSDALTMSMTYPEEVKTRDAFDHDDPLILVADENPERFGGRSSDQLPINSLPIRRQSVSIMSPLRYPGSKRRLAGYIRQALEINDIHPTIFIEPFAGGASVALQLLADNAVEHIGLNDSDPLVAAFWEVAFFDTDWLIQQIKTVDVTIDNWDRFKRTDPESIRERSMKCLFLNRTSFSGILAPSAGPIGGRNQQSSYAIDCRFPRETLIKRLRQLEALRDRVDFVWNLSWNDAMSKIAIMYRTDIKRQTSFVYCDPPFFKQAERLYNHYFRDADHVALRDALVIHNGHWLLSYDSIDDVKALYDASNHLPKHIDVLYSASDKRSTSEVIVSSLPKLPEETRVWRSKGEWRCNGRS